MNIADDTGDQLDAGLLLQTLVALKNGDLSARMPSGLAGVAGQVADTLNQIMAQCEQAIGLAPAATNGNNGTDGTDGTDTTNNTDTADTGAANGLAGSLLRQSQSLARELRQTNQELAEKARLLSAQNNEVERAKLALEEKATQLALSSKYKSEFLANMSHELRTPLNSLLILAQQLGDNRDGNLTARQVEFARTIHGSGSDLLTLINDILDLSKIESGTVTLDVAQYSFEHLRHYVERTFRHMAEARHLDFSITLCDDLPATLMTDTTRLQQVLKNLLSNAFKFTEHGRVNLSIGLAGDDFCSDRPTLCRADAVLAFTVTDTGVGIAADKLQLIFEAFQQADGSTARKYGGTGLGLSISRELARLLGGEIRVSSVVDGGSSFTLFLPCHRAGLLDHAPGPGLASPDSSPVPLPNAADRLQHHGAGRDSADHQDNDHSNDDDDGSDNDNYHDDRALLAPGEPSVLIIADDRQFAATVLAVAHAHQFKGVVTGHGDAALSLARDYLPVAVVLDLDLPDSDGLAALDRLKRDPATRHIPVHAVSHRDQPAPALRLGAQSHRYLPPTLAPDRAALDTLFARIRAFATGGKRRVLVVAGDAAEREAIAALIGADDLEIVAMDHGMAALAALRHQPDQQQFSCLVLDPGPPDVGSAMLLDAIGADRALRRLPVVVRSDGDAGHRKFDLLAPLGQGADGLVLRDAPSPERLLEATMLFLHRAAASLSAPQRHMLEALQEADGALAGRKVLIVDDDVRNIFALSSLLERQQMQVSFAENGRDGIAMLERDPAIEIVLMDIMMPEMDGYDTMRAIRRIAKFRSLPIITLTAKAMKGDRDKCIAAGASDYISKPVDVAQLLSLMRVWLH